MNHAQAEIFNELVAERERQDAKWGTKDLSSVPKWNAILMEELGEAAEYGSLDNYRTELVQVAAVAVKAIEYLDRGETLPVEDQIFIHLNRLIKTTGFLARAILDSRHDSSTGKATASEALRFLVECGTHAHAVRASLMEEMEEETAMGASR